MWRRAAVSWVRGSGGPRRGTHHLYVSRVLQSARVAVALSPAGGLSEVAGEPRSPGLAHRPCLEPDAHAAAL